MDRQQLGQLEAIKLLFHPEEAQVWAQAQVEETKSA